MVFSTLGRKRARVKPMVFLFLVLFCACSKSKFLDDDLANPLVPNNSTALRLDGYYYLKFGDTILGLKFLYRNGVVLDAGGIANSFEEADTYIQKEFVENKYHKGDKAGWGLYLITDSSIKIERWYVGQGQNKAYIKYGKIIDDTTFYISRSTRSDGSEEREKDETYYFHAFYPKPDSINQFVHP